MTTITCLHPQFLIPVEPKGSVLTKHSLVMSGNKILAILPTDQARQQYSDATHIELPQHALLPGFVNLHAHSAMSLLRGLADDLALMDWLQNHIWPAEKKLLAEEFVFDGTQLAMAEMLRGGTTTVNDMYFFEGAVARAAIASSMRTVLGCSVLEFPTNYAQNADEYMERGLAAHADIAGQANIYFRLAPHAPYTVHDATFKKIIAVAEQKKIGIHCHIHETQDEIKQSLSEYGMRPLQRLHQLGLLSPNLIAAHMVHATEDEIALLAQTGVHVAHNPASNLKLVAGFAPVDALMQAGVNVGIGTDGAASNNKIDLLGDLRLAALLAKTQAQKATALNASEALEMATLAGARALGLAHDIGSLVAGKQADVIAIDLAAIETQPLYDPISQIVYAAGREQVSHVWVAGRCLLNERQLQSLDQGAVLDKAAWWGRQIRSV